MGKHQKVYGFLPPNRVPWPDEPFSVPRGGIPARKPRPGGSIRRAGEIIWRRLDTRLDAPIHVEHSRARTRLWVLDIYYFEVDRELCRVTGGIVRANGTLKEASCFHPGWPFLNLKLEDLADRIFDEWPHEELVSLPYPYGPHKARLVAMSYVSKKLDERFRALSDSLVLHELDLDRDVYRLTREACGDSFDFADYTRVWRTLEGFRGVSVERPHLLERHESGDVQGPKEPLTARPRPKGKFSSVIGSDNHYLVHKVAVPVPREDGTLRFVYEDGFGNVKIGPTAFLGVDCRKPCVARLLEQHGLERLDDIRYVVAYHWGGYPNGAIRCLLKSLHDIPLEFYGSGGIAASRLADHLENEAVMDRQAPVSARSPSPGPLGTSA